MVQNEPYRLFIMANSTSTNAAQVRGQYEQDGPSWNITVNSRNSSNQNATWYFVGPGYDRDFRNGNPLQVHDSLGMSVQRFAETEEDEAKKFKEEGLSEYGMCRMDHFLTDESCEQLHMQSAAQGNCERCKQLQPVLTMPRERNVLKVAIMDRFDHDNNWRCQLLDYPTNVSVAFHLESSCHLCSPTALSTIQHNITRVDLCPKGTTNSVECSADMRDKTKCCQPLYYLIAFYFMAKEEFAYTVTIHIHGYDQDGSATTKALQPIKYFYALHQKQPDPLQPTLLYPARYQWTTDTPPKVKAKAKIYTRYDSVCKQLNCTDVYITTAIDRWSMNVAGEILQYGSWKLRCQAAGCLYRSGTKRTSQSEPKNNPCQSEPKHNTNTIQIVAEHGYMHRSDDIGLGNMTHWTKGDLYLYGNISLKLQKLRCKNAEPNAEPNLFKKTWGFTVSGNETADSFDDLDLHDRGFFENKKDSVGALVARTSSDRFDERVKCLEPGSSEHTKESQRVYWLPCERLKKSTVDWEEEQDAPYEFHPCSEGNAQVGRTQYDIDFGVKTPGTYNMTITCKIQGRRQVRMLSLQVDVGPGVLDIGQSLMLQPTFTRRFDGKDKYKPNPNIGADAEMNVEYNYTITAKDKTDNPRFGTDQLFARISRIDDEETLGASKFAQIRAVRRRNDKDELEYPPICFATDQLHRKLINNPEAAQTENTYPRDISTCKWGEVAVGNSCSGYQGLRANSSFSYTAGVYTFLHNFTTLGVFRMELWQCEIDDLEHCN
eukprot:COSAG01_NODE_6282_length_3755_cov_3.585339_3_plen_770_part_01